MFWPISSCPIAGAGCAGFAICWQRGTLSPALTGSWRPYCEKEIGAWAEHQAALTGAGARLIIVTPETGGRMMALSQPAGDAAVVLCDVNLGVALRYELAFPVGPRARTHPPPAPGGGPPQQPAR